MEVVRKRLRAHCISTHRCGGRSGAVGAVRWRQWVGRSGVVGEVADEGRGKERGRWWRSGERGGGWEWCVMEERKTKLNKFSSY
jgi:hypothetical protein